MGSDNMEAQKHEISKEKGFIQIGNEIKRYSHLCQPEGIVVFNNILSAKLYDLG
jgi:hypothetical protein